MNLLLVYHEFLFCNEKRSTRKGFLRGNRKKRKQQNYRTILNKSTKFGKEKENGISFFFKKKTYLL